MSITPGFASVVIDVDSTLCGIEGIDWLADRCGPSVGRAVAAFTDQAMRGVLPHDRVYGARLALVRPTVADVAALGDAYIAAIAPGAPAALARLQRASRHVVLVSGGLRDAILPVARHLGIPDASVHGVDLRRDAGGRFLGHDDASPLAQAGGKPEIVRALGLPARILAVGDGATDVEMREAADAFAAFTGFVARPPVVAAADAVLTSFDQLAELVLG